MHESLSYALFLSLWQSQLATTITENLPTILGALAALSVLLVYYQQRRNADVLDKIVRQRGMFNMDKWGPQTKERREYVKTKVADAVTDALEELYFKDELTRDEVNREYQRFGNLFSMPDFIPRCEKILKERIRERLNRKEEIYKPVPFPQEGKEELERTDNPILKFLNRHAA